MNDKLDYPVGTLLSLLAEDQFWTPDMDTGKNEAMIKCFNHEDDSPSMSVNLSKGLYYCHGCGIKGDAWNYLVDIRKMSDKEAAEILKEKHLWTPEKLKLSTDNKIELMRKRSGMPKIYTSIPKMMRKANKTAEHDYCDKDGVLKMKIVRFARTETAQGPKVLPFTPRGEGGWWGCQMLNDMIPESDSAELYPIYRLPDYLETIKDNDRQTWFVEGEKCVDAVARLTDTPQNFGPPPCTTLFGGTKKDISKYDLEPLFGRAILLLSDADKVGRDYMLRIGEVLHSNGCAVKYFLPKGDTGYDIADAILDGGFLGVAKWISEGGGVTQHSTISKESNKNKLEKPLFPLQETEHFRVLGLFGDSVIIQSKSTYRVHQIAQRGLANSAILVMIAPLPWWQELLKGEGLNNKNCLSIADAINRAADYKGIIDVGKMAMGRGAYKTPEGEIIYNLGHKLLTQDDQKELTVPLGIGDCDYIFTPGESLTITSKNKRFARQWGQELYDAISAYRFVSREDSRALIGWMVSSIIGGALPFRPMLWLLSPAGVGKSFLMKSVVNVMLGNFITYVGDATEAGIAGVAGSDSLALILDEFEPDKKKDEKWRGVLSLVRLATSGDAGRLRGGQYGGYSMTKPRFSLLISSINRPVLSSAESQRFFPIALSPKPVDDWNAVLGEIMRTVTTERCTAIRSLIIRETPKILVRASELEVTFRREHQMDTRQSQISAALTAGAGFLSGNYSPIKRSEFIADDTFLPLEELFAANVMLHIGRNLSLAEAMRQAYWDGGIFSDQKGKRNEKAQAAAFYGFKMNNEEEMWVAPSHPQMKTLLKNSRYSEIDLTRYFRSLTGAKTARDNFGRHGRITCGGISRSAIAIPCEIFHDAGFFPPSPEDSDYYTSGNDGGQKVWYND